MYCPLGSYKPKQVEIGFYSTGGDEETRIGEHICEPGFVCIGDGVKQVCPIGHYCPGRTSAPKECGKNSLFCEEGSTKPKNVSAGYFSVGGSNKTRSGQMISPPGFYAIDGIVKECPAGHYGNTEGLSDDNCSGKCDAGWYCPPASVSSKQFACGKEDLFCPRGSAYPRKVQTGYHTSTDDEPCKPGTYRDRTSNNVEISVSSIATSRMYGVCVPCQEGTFKHLPGDDMALCQKCGPKASSRSDHSTTCECFQSATEKLSTKLYFNVSTRACINITDQRLAPPDDVFPSESQMTKSKEFMCLPGHFCQQGVSYKCTAGNYGKKHFETQSVCSGPCQEGKFSSSFFHINASGCLWYHMHGLL